MSNEKKEQPMSAKEIMHKHFSIYNNEIIEVHPTSIVEVMQEYADQQTTQLIKDLENVKEVFNDKESKYNNLLKNIFELQEMCALKDREQDRYTRLYLTEKAKSNKMRKALENIYKISDEEEIWIICQRVIKSLEVEDGN